MRDNCLLVGVVLVSAASCTTTQQTPAPQSDVTSALAKYESARDLYESERFELAAEAFAAYAVDHPNHDLVPHATYWRAMSYLKLERWDDARRILEEFVEANPNQDWTPKVEELLRTIPRVVSSKAGG